MNLSLSLMGLNSVHFFSQNSFNPSIKYTNWSSTLDGSNSQVINEGTTENLDMYYGRAIKLVSGQTIVVDVNSQVQTIYHRKDGVEIYDETTQTLTTFDINSANENKTIGTFIFYDGIFTVEEKAYLKTYPHKFLYRKDGVLKSDKLSQAQIDKISAYYPMIEKNNKIYNLALFSGMMPELMTTSVLNNNAGWGWDGETVITSSLPYGTSYFGLGCPLVSGVSYVLQIDLSGISEGSFSFRDWAGTYYDTNVFVTDEKVTDNIYTLEFVAGNTTSGIMFLSSTLEGSMSVSIKEEQTHAYNIVNYTPSCNETQLRDALQVCYMKTDENGIQTDISTDRIRQDGIGYANTKWTPPEQWKIETIHEKGGLLEHQTFDYLGAKYTSGIVDSNYPIPVGNVLLNELALDGAIIDATRTFATVPINSDSLELFNNSIAKVGGVVETIINDIENTSKIKVFSGVLSYDYNLLTLISNEPDVIGMSLADNPAWLSIDVDNTLKITANTYIGSFNAGLIVTYVGGQAITYDNVFFGFMYPLGTQIADQLTYFETATPAITTSTISNILKALTGEEGAYLSQLAFKANQKAIVLVQYREKYWANCTTVAFDTETGTVISTHIYTNNGTVNNTGYGIETFPESGYTSKYLMITQFKDPDLRLGITEYDPETNTFLEDAFNLPKTFYSAYFGKPNMLPSRLVLLSGAYSGSSVGGLLTFNPITGVKVEYPNLGTLGGDYSEQGAGDSKYYYTSIGRGVEGKELVRVNIATKVSEVLLTDVEGAIILPKQTQFGAMIKLQYVNGYTDGTYFLEDTPSGIGAEWDGTDNDPNCPWGASVGYFDVTYSATIADKPVTDDTVIPPTTGGITKLWYKYPIEDVWHSIEHTVTLYQASIEEIETNSDGTLYLGGDDYSAHLQYDLETETIIGMSKGYPNAYASLQISSGETITTGYPNGVTYKIDPNQSWETGLETYHPLVPLAPDVNPVQILTCEVSGLKHARALAEADGKLFIAGSRERDGSTGGGVQWSAISDPSTVLSGFHDETENYAFSSMTAIRDEYIIVSGKGVNADNFPALPTPTEGRLFVLDAINGSIFRTLDPLPETLLTGNIIHPKDGSNDVIGMVSYAGNTYIYRVNILTDEIIYKHSIIGVNNTAYSDYLQGSANLKLGSDGYIYTMFGSAVCRIEPEFGGVEFVIDINSSGKLTELNGDIIIASGTNLVKISDVVSNELPNILP